MGDDFASPVFEDCEENVSKTGKALGRDFFSKFMLHFVIIVLKRFSLEMYQYLSMLNT